jgi:hypothetical protein
LNVHRLSQPHKHAALASSISNALVEFSRPAYTCRSSPCCEQGIKQSLLPQFRSDFVPFPPLLSYILVSFYQTLQPRQSLICSSIVYTYSDRLLSYLISTITKMPANYKTLPPIRQPRGPTDCAGFVAFQQRKQCSQTPPPAPSSNPVDSYCSSSSTPRSVSSIPPQTMTWLSVYGNRKPFYQTIRFEESRYASRFLADAGRYDPISPGYRHAHCEVWLNDVLNSLLTGWQFPLREVAKPSQRPIPPPPPNTPEPATSRPSTSYARHAAAAAAAEPGPTRMVPPAPTKPRQPKIHTPTEQAKSTGPTPRSPLMAPPAPSKPRPYRRERRREGCMEQTEPTRPMPRSPLMAPPAPSKPRPYRRERREGRTEPPSSARPTLFGAPISHPRHREQPARKPALWVPSTPPRARGPRKRVRISEPSTSPELAPPRPRMARPEPQDRPATAPTRDPVVFIEGRPLTLLLRRGPE